MDQTRLRLLLFGFWIFFWMIACVILVASAFRRDEAISIGQAMAGIMTVSGVWIPPLTCFAVYWFPRESPEDAQASHVARERAIGAIVLTIVYLLLVDAFVFSAAFISDFPTDHAELLSSESFEELLSQVVKIGLLVSPVALAPTAWVTKSTDSSLAAPRAPDHAAE